MSFVVALVAAVLGLVLIALGVRGTYPNAFRTVTGYEATARDGGGSAFDKGGAAGRLRPTVAEVVQWASGPARPSTGPAADFAALVPGSATA